MSTFFKSNLNTQVHVMEQTYMQLAKRILKKLQFKRKMQMINPEIDLWLSKNSLLKDMKLVVMESVGQRLEENKGLGFDCGDFGVISVRSSGGMNYDSRRWIQNPNRCADEYLDGIEDFIEFARRQNPGATRIHCPCRRCNNTLFETIENVGFHLVRNGMIETYSIWNLHGEQVDHASSSNAPRVDNVEPIVDPNDQVMGIIQDAFPFASTNINQEGEDDVPTLIDSAEFEQYEKLLKNANQELYPGCESFSVLTAIGELMHGKIKYRMSNLCFDYFLGVFKRMLSTDNCLPKDHKHAQKVLHGLGLGYEKIHACKNNCMLFYKEHETLDTCPICNESRFKMTSQNRTTKIPQKEGSKFPEIDVFGDVYVRPGNELAESLHTTMVERSQLVLQESASQLPPETPIESVALPQDAGFQILMETLDQTLGRRPGT
ncbi:hypothetical protein L3X38_039916 [Prunus dulcis]|uniref:Transposase-associated domain-containing protein n=1 Tax=Prunus dulcis TaxID=3755 RepID=A0AAD4V8F8_PRUDU|nr:hypothetical protein L3X38_039916 [Prunus dulcis]